MSKEIRLVIVIFLGMFGTHKFIDKDYKNGFLYLFTGGLFGIGWIVDIIKELTGTTKDNKKTMMSIDSLNTIDNGRLPIIIVPNLNLSPGEFCHYVEQGNTFKDRIETTGYTGKNSGISIRVMKGITYRTGGSGGRAMRETKRVIYTGTIYVTNKRIIYNSSNECFDKKNEKITSIQELKDGVIIQIGSTSYSIMLNNPSVFIKVFNMVSNKNI